MGAGASFVKDDRKTGSRDERDRDEFPYPRRQYSDRMHSTRSGKTFSSVNTTRSVRAMALMNHSRHENSYITTEEISIHLRQRQKGEPNSITLRSLDSKIEESPHEYDPSEKKSEKKDAESIHGEFIDEANLIQTQTSVKSLRAFRTNFNLKLNLADEPDWGQVSDDDPDGIDDGQLNVFDKHLIEIPLGDSHHTISVDVSTKNETVVPDENNANNNLVLQGGLSFGHQGIIRHDKPVDHHGKLTMRERLIILCKLGSGASSAVYKALDITDMRLVALKTIQVNEKDKRVQMVREVSALFQLLRENSRRESSQYRNFKKPERYIVDFYDAFSNPEDGVVCLMIEYMDGGSLQDIVDQGGCDDEISLANIAVQALKGLSFLHSCSQIHRDLKPGNFLISHRGEVKVADLGIMKQLPAKVPGKLQKTNTFVGTATYMSPERIDGKDYSFPADVWAFGLSMATIALGRLPIDTRGGYWTILHGIRDEPSPSLPADRFSPEFCDFINSCLKKNPDERASCKELLKHDFLRKAQPEDLTFDQNDARGRHELVTMLQGMVKHIHNLKKIYREKYHQQIEKYVESRTIIHEKLFGNLLEHSTSDILKQIIFHNTQMNVNSGNVIGNAMSSKNGRLTKPRLTTLSKQLNLPLETVIKEVKQFCDSIIDQ